MVSFQLTNFDLKCLLQSMVLLETLENLLIHIHLTLYILLVVGKGEVLTPEHFLLGISLHNKTGQRKIAQISNRLGHSISYDKVFGIETAYAAYVQKVHKTIESSEYSILPLKPATTSDSVTTFFWADNFDKVYYSIKKKLLKAFVFSETLEKGVQFAQS